jgi:hypothetical protein
MRPVKAAIDLAFVRTEVAHCYGKKRNESVALEVIGERLRPESLLLGQEGGSESLHHTKARHR